MREERGDIYDLQSYGMDLLQITKITGRIRIRNRTVHGEQIIRITMLYLYLQPARLIQYIRLWNASQSIFSRLTESHERFQCDTSGSLMEGNERKCKQCLSTQYCS